MKALKYHSTNNGFCRAYYRDANKENKTLYCLQSDSNRTKDYMLYVCSKDGEPSHSVPILNCTFDRARGNEITDKEINNFLEDLKETQEELAFESRS